MVFFFFRTMEEDIHWKGGQRCQVKIITGLFFFGTLYATRAMDVVQNVSQGQAAAVAEALLAHTNMNNTGHFGLYHVDMEVRLTQTLAAPHVVPASLLQKKVSSIECRATRLGQTPKHWSCMSSHELHSGTGWQIIQGHLALIFQQASYHSKRELFNSGWFSGEPAAWRSLPAVTAHGYWLMNILLMVKKS